MTKKIMRQVLPLATIGMLLLASPTVLARGTSKLTNLFPHPGVERVATSPQLITQNPPMRVDQSVARATLKQLLAGVQKTPEQPVVRRTIVEGDYALATWLWGEAGGQSILVRKQGRWQVVSAGGGAVDLATLQQKGVPANVAWILLEREQKAQQR